MEKQGVLAMDDQALFVLIKDYLERDFSGQAYLNPTIREIDPNRIATLGLIRADKVIDFVESGGDVTEELKKTFAMALKIAFFGRALMGNVDGWVIDGLNVILDKAAQIDGLDENSRKEKIATIRDAAWRAAGFAPKKNLERKNYARRSRQ